MLNLNLNLNLFAFLRFATLHRALPVLIFLDINALTELTGRICFLAPSF